MTDPTEELLKVIKDKKKEDEERVQAAHMYGLQMFAEHIGDRTVRISNDMHDKLNTYIALLRLLQKRNKQ